MTTKSSLENKAQGLQVRQPVDTGRIYVCIDLKSFYASVECVDRGLDPFTTNLVVADPTRTEKTICLAITPAMKAIGIKNRCRVFEIPTGIDYIMAPPRMKHYVEVSTQIYGVYLRYVSPEDIHVYSVDECFIDVTAYLKLYDKTPREFAIMLMDAVFAETGICATAGIGTNMFLAKVALDITAKHVDDHIGYLDEARFKVELWDYKPITDVWNIGPGIANRLKKYGVSTLRGVCQMSERTLYKEFGTNAEYLIDHAYGYEPCTIREIQAYKPGAQSLSNGQVLGTAYNYEDTFTIFKEMVDALILDLVSKDLVAGRISLVINYVKESDAPSDNVFIGEHGVSNRWKNYPHTGGTRKMARVTDSRKVIRDAFIALFEETTRRDGMIRRLNVGLGDVVPKEFETFDLFTDVEAEKEERALQKAVLDVQKKFGKNAMFKAISLTEKATGRARNETMGGHRA